MNAETTATSGVTGTMEIKTDTKIREPEPEKLLQAGKQEGSIWQHKPQQLIQRPAKQAGQELQLLIRQEQLLQE